MNEAYYTYRIRIPDLARVQVEVRDPQNKLIGEPQGKFRYQDVAVREQITTLVQQAVAEKLDGDTSKLLGETLFNTLFDDVLRQDFVNLYNTVVHKEDKLLRLELDIDERSMPDVAALPWEFMRVPSEANLGTLWLGTAPDIIFSRRRAQWNVPNPIQLERGEKLRLAYVVSAPDDLGTIKYEQVQLCLEQLAQKMPDRFELLPVVNPANPAAIDEVLAKKPHIFHYSGHGRLLEENGKSRGQIALVDEFFGSAMWVDADYFSDLFNTHRPGIVYLDACEGATASGTQAFVSVASYIVAQNIPVVLAMQYEVSNITSIRFALSFYQRLVEADPVDRAVQVGRRAISQGPTMYNTRDFATPVLFMRVADGHLFQREGGVAAPQIVVKPANGGEIAAEPREIPPGPATLTLPQVASLGRQISESFNEEELREFCLEIGIDYEDLRGSSKSSKARELADYCRRQGKVVLLWEQLHLKLPNITWKV